MYKAERNPSHTAIHPRKYEADMQGDDELSERGLLFSYLRRLSEAVSEGVAVPTFVESNPYEYPAGGGGGGGEPHELPSTAFLFDDPATIFIDADVADRPRGGGRSAGGAEADAQRGGEADDGGAWSDAE